MAAATSSEIQSVDAEDDLDDARQQVEVDAGDEQLGHGEAEGVDQVGLGAEPAAHELRHRTDLGAVVERHHHDAQEQHRRDGADPEVVDRRDAVVGAVGGHADDLDGAQVGRDERQSGHPGGECPSGQEEVQAARDGPAGHDPDAEDEDEVERDQQVVDELRIEPERAVGRENHPVISSPCDGHAPVRRAMPRRAGSHACAEKCGRPRPSVGRRRRPIRSGAMVTASPRRLRPPARPAGSGAGPEPSSSRQGQRGARRRCGWRRRRRAAPQRMARPHGPGERGMLGLEPEGQREPRPLDAWAEVGEPPPAAPAQPRPRAR